MRFWYGMRLATLLRTVLRHRAPGRPLHWRRLATGLAIGAVNSALTPLDRLVWAFAGNREALDPAPVFVIGHWRCGTTYLHELLALDPRHTAPTTYQCMAPDHFVASQNRLRRWLLPPISGVRPVDEVMVGWDRPQEDEFALCNLGLPSPYVFLMFPERRKEALAALDLTGLSDRQRDKWKAQLTRFLKRVSHGAPEQRIILKSPPHTARVPLLAETFPDARFVHIVRHPLDVVASMQRLYRVLLPMLQISADDLGEDEINEHILAVFQHLDASAAAGCAACPPGTLTTVHYEQLVADPVDTLRKLYQDLELGDFAVFETTLRRHLELYPPFPRHRHTISAALTGKVYARLAGYFTRYGYTANVPR